MKDKKIITRNDVKENNPNDDEEILKNIDFDIDGSSDNNEEDKSENKHKKPDGDETIGIP